MLIRIAVLCLVGCITLSCNDKISISNGKHKNGNLNDHYLNSDLERCFVVWGTSNEFPKSLVKKLSISLDEIESSDRGLNYNIIVSASSIRFITAGNPKTHIYKVTKKKDNLFSLGTSSNFLFFQFSFDETNKHDRISFYNSEEDLMKKENKIAIGDFFSPKESLCLDRERLKLRYEEAKREIEAGPALDGADPEKLKKQWEEEQKKK